MDLGLPLEIQEDESKFPITLYIETVQGSYNLRLMYQKELFSSARMVIFLEQLEHLLEQSITWPDKIISSYSLVPLKRKHLFPDANAILDEPAFPVISDWISDWAKRMPDQPAICQAGRMWTYQELYSRATSIAHGLILERSQPGDVIAVTGIKSFGLYASMLGVFLSAGTLLCIDPNLPDRRKQLMLQEFNASHVLIVDKAFKRHPTNCQY